jgi:hypothetical protein
MPQYLIAICFIIGIFRAYKKIAECRKTLVPNQPEYYGFFDFLLHTDK